MSTNYYNITARAPEWWEMLDWNVMKDSYELLPEEVKTKIKENSLAPV